MPTIQRFEDIEAWMEARKLVRVVYEVSGDGRFAWDYGLRDQIQRASVSVMSNIAEGFERGGGVEFRRFLTMAKGSAAEVKSQLYVALDAGLIDEERFGSLYQQADTVSKVIGGLKRYLTNSSRKTVPEKR